MVVPFGHGGATFGPWSEEQEGRRYGEFLWGVFAPLEDGSFVRSCVSSGPPELGIRGLR